MNSVLGTKFNVVAGFKGMSSIFLGMERGELHGVSTVYGSVKGLKPEWLAQKKVRFIAQIAEMRIKELPDVPTVLEIAKTDEDRATLRFLTLSNVIGRSIAAPPGVPADRLAALRKAFDETVRSDNFLKETRDKGIDINPTPGLEVQQDVDRLFATPKAIIEKVKAIVGAASSGKR
jgi:tripartite-type tricarboxylate transporter receptor subunit TctC